MRMVSLAMALGLALGCSGSDKPYYVPVDSPAKPFVPPEAEDLVGGEDGDDWGGDDGDDDDGGDGNGDTTDPADAKRAISMAIVQSRRQFENCYNQALQRAPTLRGRVELVLVVGADGVPTSSKATGLAGVAKCVAEVARGLVFPKPTDGKPVTISYPFVFAPSS